MKEHMSALCNYWTVLPVNLHQRQGKGSYQIMVLSDYK